MKYLLAPLLALAISLGLYAEAGPAKAPVATGAVVAPVAPDGTPPRAALPIELHQKNRGGSDGVGLCVFASMRHTGRWQNEPVFEGLFEYMWTRPGGSYPEKTDKMIQSFARDKGLPVPDYVQVVSKDLEVLVLALKTGRMPGVTYGYSPTGRYRGRIAHMVSLVYAEGDKWAILDNNFPGTYEWMSRSEFLRAYTAYGNGWCVINLSPPPPPAPVEAKPSPRMVELRDCLCGDGCRCPRECPRECPPVTGSLAQGIDVSKISKAAKHTRRGHACSASEAKAAVKALADDSAKYRLTVFGGTPEGRKAVVDAVRADKSLADLVLVQSYDAGHWAVKGHRPVAGLSVYLQKPDGTVLVGADGSLLAKLIEKLKLALNLVQPTPDPVIPLLPAPFGPLNTWAVPAVLVGIILLLLWRR